MIADSHTPIRSSGPGPGPTIRDRLVAVSDLDCRRCAGARALGVGAAGLDRMGQAMVAVLGRAHDSARSSLLAGPWAAGLWSRCGAPWDVIAAAHHPAE